jgi:small-conductance mechanosensitive channel/CRP-like cAMP-binding protein
VPLTTFDQHSVYAVLVFLIAAVFLLRAAPQKRAQILAACALFLVSSGLLAIAHFLFGGRYDQLASIAHIFGLIAGGIAIVELISAFIYDVLLRPFREHSPRIVRDLLVALAYVGVILWAMHEHGVTISGIVTTSAVLTAVIGFSMQDTLGNMAGGLALQMEKTVNVGDWIRVGANEGRVKEIRWRHLSIETRNWDTVVIPNSQIMRSEVLVLGRRKHEPQQRRMWVYFNVDFRTPPSQVVAAVEEALRSEPVANVAAEPAANCIAFAFKESYVEYAVRYWLTDIAQDDATNSHVRVIVFFALRRAGIPISIPAETLFISQDTAERREKQEERELLRRMEALKGVELFQTLREEELRALAARLRYAPFARGEAMTKQGADAHWLYVITRGSAEVSIAGAEGSRRTVAMLQAGDFFGEISLMTGVPRTATVIAVEDTDCYRLDKDGFHSVLLKRPEIAEHISHVLARRLEELGVMRDQLNSAIRNSKESAQRDIFHRITEFFGLADKDPKGRAAGRG